MVLLLMAIITHRSSDHKINPKTESLIIGTFNPDTVENQADFFYGRQRNFLWSLLPISFGETGLKGKTRDSKQKFIERHKIDFIDLISSAEVDEVANYKDEYLDSRVVEWQNVIAVLKQLPNIKRVCVTRKSFSGIPNMKTRIEAIKDYCEQRKIKFKCLVTPSRFYSQNKQMEWSDFFNDKTDTFTI